FMSSSLKNNWILDNRGGSLSERRQGPLWIRSGMQSNPHVLALRARAAMGIPEPDQFVAELAQVLIHGETPLLKDTVSFLHNLVDHVPCGEDQVDWHTGLFRTPDQRLPEEPDAVPDTVGVGMPGLFEIPSDTICLDAEEVIEDFLVFALPEHVLVMGVRVHLLKFCRDDSACAEDNNMVLWFVEYLSDDHPDQLVARARAVGFPDRTGHENGNIFRGHIIFVDNVPVRLLKLRKVKRGVGEDRP